MPALLQHGAIRLREAAREWETMSGRIERGISPTSSLMKRILIPTDNTSDPGLIAASKRDPWIQSAKYGLGWVYFCLFLLIAATAMRLYHLWTDKIRTALYEEEFISKSADSSPDSCPDFGMGALPTNNTAAKLFPREKVESGRTQSSVSSVGPVNRAIALARYIFYRPVPSITWRKRHLAFPSLAVIAIVSCALAFVTLYSFLPQPLFYASIAFGSPPLAVRAGMLAIAMMPWIIAMSMKANLVSFLTGIGHERLNVLHRWGGYLCLLLSILHTVPFYVQPVWNDGGLAIFGPFLSGSPVIYGTGIACLAPLIWLCLASLPFIRAWMYELFVALHVPVAVLYVAMLFWHCQDYLHSWSYLYATVAIWAASYLARLFHLNWTNPWRVSWLIGEECSVSLLSENAIKVTIPTETRWRPGQYVYLRMPGISVFENHPFTIASLYSDDFPSEYGDAYRDMTLVFKPFGGFTRKVLDTALAKGPNATYRAFVDGPYGGSQRRLEAFDSVVLIAGGSGITAVVSQLLELIKRMRDGKAVTRSVQVIWAIKRLESMEWFREELRICRENAPPDSVHCQFFVTAAKRQSIMGTGADGAGTSQASNRHPGRPISGLFGSEKIEHLAQGIASKRNSALIREEAGGDLVKERELRRENEDGITALPGLLSSKRVDDRDHTFNLAPPPATARRGFSGRPNHRQRPSLSLSTTPPASTRPPPYATAATLEEGNSFPTAPAPQAAFDFGFPSTPTIFQKNLMRFAFGVSGVHTKKAGWSTEYGRPDIPYMLRDASKTFGARTLVFVCGPPAMRTDVARTVAGLQRDIWSGRVKGRDEIALHAENYAI